MIDIQVLNLLNAPTKEARLANLKEVLKTTEFPPMVPQYINNHIHTTYSFSPYSPTAAVYAARMEGLCTAGIIDHDSISGAEEFLEAAEIIDIPVTIGMECRVSMDGTRLEGRRTNNPDQVGCSYMTIQSVPHDKIGRLTEFFAPYRAARDERNRKMIVKINELCGVELDYDRDVLPLSEAADNGGVTERHLMSINSREARLYASQGQQRSLALAMKLAEGEISKNECGEYPVFLFDDVMSELDESRRSFLIRGMAQKQVIMTSCDRLDGDYKAIEVCGGTYS